MTPRWTRFALLLIITLYAVLGSLYALYTPAWQAPDEPAHYNYVRYLVENASFPVLHPGDYPHGYLEQIKAAKFPPEMPIDGIRYEFHQPPLYYALAAPVFALFRNVQGPWATAAPGLLPLRLFSLLLGLPLILLNFAIARRIFPGWPALAVAVAAFAALLPRHLASVAQAGNDTLSELLLAAVLLILVNRLVARRVPSALAGDPQLSLQDSRTTALIVLGILLGLIAITKTTAYFALALILGVVLWEWRCARGTARQLARDLVLVGLPAALLALPWYLRDISVYGWPDFLGLRMHDMIVTGQMRPAEFLARYGTAAYAQQFIVVTFESFWAVFGWQGVFIDVRIYEALAVLCAAVLGGLLLGQRQVRRSPALVPGQRYALRLLAVSAACAVLVYAWYNTQFVQFQGRYLFTALIPIAVAFALGWHAALRHGRTVALALAALALIVAVAGLTLAHGLPKWPVVLSLAGAAFFLARSLLARLPIRLATLAEGFCFALPYAVLPLLALYCLFGAVVPQLK